MWRKIFPELAEFAVTERKHQFDEAQRVAMRKRPVVSALLIGGGVLVAIALERTFQLPRWKTGLSLLPPFFVCFVLLRTAMRQYFWQELARRGKPICVCCGYNLTGNESGVCPECGSAIVLDK